jgi:hypothetical protein
MANNYTVSAYTEHLYTLQSNCLMWPSTEHLNRVGHIHVRQVADMAAKYRFILVELMTITVLTFYSQLINMKCTMKGN